MTKENNDPVRAAFDAWFNDPARKVYVHNEPSAYSGYRAAHAAQSEALAQALEDLQRWASWIVINRREHFADHACARCVPHSDMLVDGFTCTYHEALDVLGGKPLKVQPSQHPCVLRGAEGLPLCVGTCRKQGQCLERTAALKSQPAQQPGDVRDALVYGTGIAMVGADGVRTHVQLTDFYTQPASGKDIEDAYKMGQFGSEHNEAERLKFEAYMSGHCWGIAPFDTERICYGDIQTRMLFAVWRDCAALSRRPAAAPDLHRYACNLATAIWEKHYKADAPQWQVLPDTYGALSQIDNMVTGLSRAAIAAARPSAGLTDEQLDAIQHAANFAHAYGMDDLRDNLKTILAPAPDRSAQ